MCFSEKERGKVWKDYMEGIINEENYWDHNVEGDAVEGPVVCVSREEVLQALSEMKTVKAPGPSEVPLEFIAASGGVDIQMMAEICWSVIDGYEMPVEWVLCIVLPISKGRGTSGTAVAVNLLEHGMKVVLEKSLHGIVTANEMPFGFMTVSRTIDVVLRSIYLEKAAIRV